MHYNTFKGDKPAFSPIVLPRGDKWPALPAHINTAHAAQALTKIAAPDPAALAAVRSGKRNSNCARLTDGKTMSFSPPADQDSDVTLVANIGESDGNSNYVKSAKNSPTSPANTPDLAGHMSKLEEMNEAAESKLVEITQPTVLFSRIDKLELREINYAETNPTENHQENGDTPPVNTQPYPPHSPLEDASVSPAVSLPHPRIKAGNAALQAREGDLQDVCLLGDD